MEYRVKLLPGLCVLDADEQPVADAHVIEIRFLGDAIQTLHGRVNTITGPGSAKIIVGVQTIRTSLLSKGASRPRKKLELAWTGGAGSVRDIFPWLQVPGISPSLWMSRRTAANIC